MSTSYWYLILMIGNIIIGASIIYDYKITRGWLLIILAVAMGIITGMTYVKAGVRLEEERLKISEKSELKKETKEDV